LCATLIAAAPITDEVPVSATTTRRALLRRVMTRSATLLATAALVTACANPTGPTDMNSPQKSVANDNSGVTIGSSGVTIGSSGAITHTTTTKGVTIGSS
jgi:hypothetical protein